MEITIPWTPVKAILNLAGKADIRTHINGVWIDRQGAHLIVWATTGTVLGAYETGEPSTEGPDVFLPRHIVETCLKTFSGMATVKREGDGRMSITCLGTTHYWQDGKFTPVDWRRVIPASNTGIAQQFDAQLVAGFLKAHKALGKKEHTSAVRIAHNGGPTNTTAPGGAIVLLRDVPEFIGILSPVLQDDQGSVFTASAPDWVRRQSHEPAVEEAADLV